MYLNEQEQEQLINELERKIERLYQGEMKIQGLLDQKLVKAVEIEADENLSDKGKAESLKNATSQIDQAIDESYDPETEKSTNEIIETLTDQSYLRLDLKRHEDAINRTLDRFLVSDAPINDPSTIARAQMCLVAENRINNLYSSTSRMSYQRKLALYKKAVDSNDRLTLGFFESNQDLIIGPRGDTKSDAEGMAKIELQTLINHTINSRLNPRVVELKTRLDAIKKSKEKSERTYKSKVQGLSPKIQEVIYRSNIRRAKDKYKK
jgi:hypothetical protein